MKSTSQLFIALVSSAPLITSASYEVVADIRPGPAGSEPSDFKRLSDNLVAFIADDGTHGREWWRTDGTAEGTEIVADIRPGPSGSEPSNFERLSDDLFAFTADDGTHGREWWRTDGTADGTEIWTDLTPGSGSTLVSSSLVFNGNLYFVGYESEDGTWLGAGVNALWVANETSFFKILALEKEAEYFRSFVEYMDELYFSEALKLYKISGEGSSPVLIKDLSSMSDPSDYSYIQNFAQVNGKLLFGLSEGGLWVSDGSTEGTVLINDQVRANFRENYPPVLNGRLYFQGNVSLWSTDGTAEGTVQATPLNMFVWFPEDVFPFVVNGRVIFIVDEHYLFSTDGIELVPLNMTEAYATETGAFDKCKANFEYGEAPGYAGGPILAFPGSITPLPLSVKDDDWTFLVHDWTFLGRDGYIPGISNCTTLWSTRGTSHTTRMYHELEGVRPVRGLLMDDGRYLLRVVFPDQILVTDGTTDGMKLVARLNSKDDDEFIEMDTIQMGNEIVFTGRDAINDTGVELLKATIPNALGPSPTSSQQPTSSPSQPLSSSPSPIPSLSPSSSSFTSNPSDSAAVAEATDTCGPTRVYAAGSNFFGQFGNGPDSVGINEKSPVLVETFGDGLVDVATGVAHSVIVKQDGTAWTAGWGQHGQLGHDDTNDLHTFKKVDGLQNITRVAAGPLNTFFISVSGEVFATGENVLGALGVGDTIDRVTPTKIPIDDVVAVAVGFDRTLFLKSDRTVYVAGSNDRGQLCVDDNSQPTSPTQITTLSDVKQIAAGGFHSVFLTYAGDVYACGLNVDGQLGVGDNKDRNTTSIVGEFSFAVTSIAALYISTSFLLEDGSVYSTGRNDNGQLGVGDYIDRNAPVSASINGVAEIHGSKFWQLFFRRNDGTIWSTGANFFGQLGVGDAANKTTPTEVVSLAEEVISYVAVGSDFTLFVANSLCHIEAPSFAPTDTLSEIPSQIPSKSSAPTAAPSSKPTTQPSTMPSKSSMPTAAPSATPSNQPSTQPSMSSAPSAIPTAEPTEDPSKAPTNAPASGGTVAYLTVAPLIVLGVFGLFVVGW